MSTQIAPTIDPSTTDHDDDDDGLIHKFCPCQRKREPMQQTAWCGKKPSPSGWHWYEPGTAPAHEICVVCEDLRFTTACRYCGKSLNGGEPK